MKKKQYNKRIITFSIMLLFSLLLYIPVSASGKYVATVDGKSFTSLQKAIDSAKNGQTITVTSNIISRSSIIIKKSGKLTINFAGNKYTYTGSKNAFQINKGNIVIKNGNIQSQNYVFNIKKNALVSINKGTYKGYNYNKGTLTIKNGTFNDTGAKDSKADELIQNYGTLTINKGKFANSRDNAIYNLKKLIINGGTFNCTAKFDEYYSSVYNKKNGTCIINDGTFSGKACAYENEGKTQINGGTFKSHKINAVANIKGTMTINGGTFNRNGTDYFVIWNYLGNLNINDAIVKDSIGNETNGKHRLKITGGTFYSYGNNNSIYNTKGLVQITGGKFISAKSNPIYNESKGIIKISNGTFIAKDYYYALYNLGEAYLTGGTFSSKNNANSICSIKGSILQINTNVRYTGKVDYK